MVFDATTAADTRGKIAESGKLRTHNGRRVHDVSFGALLVHVEPLRLIDKKGTDRGPLMNDANAILKHPLRFITDDEIEITRLEVRIGNASTRSWDVDEI